jgi:nitrite transporter
MVKETVKLFANMSVQKIESLNNSISRYFVLSMLAGVYVGFGIILIFSIGGPLKAIGDVGLKALMGASFGVALTLVIFAGSELFTGNNMVMTIGSLTGKVSWLNTIKLWIICYIGNLAGALLLSYVISKSGVLCNGPGKDFITKVSLAKGSGEFLHLFLKGVLCNILVCLAVWTSARAKDDTAKILLIFWCLFAFIGSGFEHSIANMTVIGIGLCVSPETIQWGHLWHNLLPVTLGNIFGGSVCVGAAYWFVANKQLKELD